MKKWKVMLLTGVAVLTLSACNGKEDIATMKHENITQDAFYEELKTRYGSDVLEEMLQKSMLLDKYKVTDKEMENRMDYYMNVAGVENEKDFETYLKSAGYNNLEEFKEDLRFNISQVKAVTDGIKISEKEIKAEYEEQKLQISASHILVDSEELANEIYTKIQNNEATFEDLAYNHSTDTTSAANSGSLGFFSKGTMTEAFETVAFAMKKGEVSQPVKTEFGYHIIRLDDTKEVPYDELKLIIEEELKMAQAKDYETILSDLKKEYKMEIKDGDLKKLLQESVSE